MHALSFPCKLHFAVLWTCLSSCTWWGVMCCCLISSMADFTFWNCAQFTAIKVVFRQRKPKKRPIACNDVKHCKTLIETTEILHKISSFRSDDETNYSLNQCKCWNDIFVQIFRASFHLEFRRKWCKFSPNK